jgi:hypothetical protein
VIPDAATANSPGEVKRFVADWNRYVRASQSAVAEMASMFDRAMALKTPTRRFLLRTRAAIRVRDGAGYRRAVETYTAQLKRLGEDLYGADGLPDTRTGEEADRALKAMIADANGSEAVGRLVNALRQKYPGSVFARRMTR